MHRTDRTVTSRYRYIVVYDTRGTTMFDISPGLILRPLGLNFPVFPVPDIITTTVLTGRVSSQLCLTAPTNGHRVQRNYLVPQCEKICYYPLPLNCQRVILPTANELGDYTQRSNPLHGNRYESPRTSPLRALFYDITNFGGKKRKKFRVISPSRQSPLTEMNIALIRRRSRRYGETFVTITTTYFLCGPYLYLCITAMRLIMKNHQVVKYTRVYQ